MSYLKGETWTLTPVSSYKIIRNCPKCGTRSLFQSTGNFRINANKKCVDIWLIYQCEKCRSTYNLTIFERVSPKKLPEGSYKKVPGKQQRPCPGDWNSQRNIREKQSCCKGRIHLIHCNQREYRNTCFFTSFGGKLPYHLHPKPQRPEDQGRQVPGGAAFHLPVKSKTFDSRRFAAGKSEGRSGKDPSRQQFAHPS